MGIFKILFLLRSFLVSGFNALWKNKFLFEGFDFTKISSVMSIKLTLSTVLDFPTGILADRFGYKICALTGFGIIGIGFTVPLFIQADAWGLGACILLVGIGSAIVNGALDAWAAYTQDQSEAGIESKKFAARDSFQKIGSALSAIVFLVGTGLMTGNLRWVWFTFALASWILFALACLAPEERGGKVHRKSRRLAKVGSHFISVWKLPALQLMAINGFLFGCCDGLRGAVYWSRMKDLGLTDWLGLGVLQIINYLSWVLGLQIWSASGRMESKTVAGEALLFGATLGIVFAWITNPNLALATWILRTIVLSAYFAGLQNMILRLTPAADIRASMLAGNSLLYSIGMIVATGLAGFFGSEGQESLWLTVGMVAGLVGGLLLIRANRIATGQATSSDG
jgi:MFS family permease